jgi:DNA-binding NtrC family response regulator
MRNRLALVEAFYNEEHDKIKEIVLSTDKSDPIYKHYHVIWLLLSQEITLEEKKNFLRTALESPPSNTELFIILLLFSVILATQSNQVAEAQRAFDLMQQLSKEGVENDVKVSILRSKARIENAADHYQEELEALTEALKLNRVGTKRWAIIQTSRIATAIENEDFDLAYKNLEGLRPYANLTTTSFSGSYEFLRARYLYSSGKANEAMVLVDSKSSDELPNIQRDRKTLRIQCLIKTEKFEQAEHLLNTARMEAPREINQHRFQNKLYLWEIEHLRAYLALAKKDFQTVRHHCQNALSIISHQSPRFIRESHRLILSTELASRHSRAARVYLNILDPEESKPTYAAEWARLYLLEGDRNRAAHHFQKLTNHTIPELIEDKLRYAFELSISQVTSLLFSSKNEKTLAATHLHTEGKEPKESHSFELAGESAVTAQVRTMIEKFAPVKSSILITGEAGTGKKMIARLLHFKSVHKSEPFIPVNCGASSDTLLTSELFGHLEGAFTDANRNRDGFFVEAGKGTIFLDEIDLLSPQLQTRILRVLENKEVVPIGGQKPKSVQARIIATTHKSLENILRKDLYFLLTRAQIHIPPLRERVEDIPLLAKHFLRRLYGKFDIVLSDDLIEALKKYSWPGNVTQLKNEMERMAMKAGQAQVLSASIFQPDILEEPKVSKRVKQASPNQISHRSPPAPKSSTQDPATFSHYTMDRRHALQELFTTHGRLTKADVVRLLNCAPNTAAKDLKVLMQEGFIRRIDTSAHLRTSYFELSTSKSPS